MKSEINRLNKQQTGSSRSYLSVTSLLRLTSLDLIQISSSPLLVVSKIISRTRTSKGSSPPSSVSFSMKRIDFSKQVSVAKLRRSLPSYRTVLPPLVKLSSSLLRSLNKFTKSHLSPSFRTTLSFRQYLPRKKTLTNMFHSTLSLLLPSTTSSLRLWQFSRTRSRLTDLMRKRWCSSLPLELPVWQLHFSNVLAYKRTDKKFSRSILVNLKVRGMRQLKLSRMLKEVCFSLQMLQLEAWISVSLSSSVKRH